jgi:hypothetical protein
LWVIFALLDPDPDSEYGSGSTGPIESGSNWDPDPQPCRKQRYLCWKHIRSAYRCCTSMHILERKQKNGPRSIEAKFSWQVCLFKVKNLLISKFGIWRTM